jgi:hypothetical protein
MFKSSIKYTPLFHYFTSLPTWTIILLKTSIIVFTFYILLKIYSALQDKYFADEYSLNQVSISIIGIVSIFAFSLFLLFEIDPPQYYAIENVADNKATIYLVNGYSSFGNFAISCGDKSIYLTGKNSVSTVKYNDKIPKVDLDCRS